MHLPVDFGLVKELRGTATRDITQYSRMLGTPLYMALYGAGIIFFCFFYTAVVFNPEETSENLKKAGGFIPGIRPGEQTARYIDKILVRLTLAGAVYITFVCLLPEFLIGQRIHLQTLS